MFFGTAVMCAVYSAYYGGCATQLLCCCCLLPSFASSAGYHTLYCSLLLRGFRSAAQQQPLQTNNEVSENLSSRLGTQEKFIAGAAAITPEINTDAVCFSRHERE